MEMTMSSFFILKRDGYAAAMNSLPNCKSHVMAFEFV